MGQVRNIKPSEIESAGEVLTRAFFDDDLVKYMFPDEAFRKSFLPWIYSKWVGVLANYNSVFVDDDMKGVIVCLPPPLYLGVSLMDQVRGGLLGVIPRLGMRRIWRPFRVFLDNMKRTRNEVTVPTWIIDVLGVSPQYQRKGIGSLLVREILKRAEEENVPAYVITHKLENVKFYEKNGFKLIKIVNSLPGGPPTCSLMFRK
ncbi:MAG: GNAT family N-acetyltransferase [Candidatus Hydrogenedentes bacterium]|nr:GNAT family N-acetyltransferase [Candidatus Hydrogenedentota bacterium]